MSKKNTTQNLNNELSSEIIIKSDEILNTENNINIVVDNDNVNESNIDDSTPIITETVVESEISDETINNDVENMPEEIVTPSDNIDVDANIIPEEILTPSNDNLVVDSNITSEIDINELNLKDLTSTIAETVVESKPIVRTIDSLSKDEYRQYQRTGRMPM